MTFVGIDGGATHMRLLVLAEDGALIAHDGPGVSPEFFGADAAAKEVARLARRAGAPPDSRVTAAVCMAGVDTTAERRAMETALAEALPGWDVRLFNDMAAALTAGAPDGGPAAVASAGTGANAAGRSADGQFFSLRAKGYVQGNFGGGYDVVREALHAAFRSEERTGPRTSLEGAVLALTGLPDFDALSDRLGEENYVLSLVGRLPPLVTAHADAGDDVAREILTRIGVSLAGLAAGAARKARIDLNDAFPVVLAGGVALSGTPFLEGAFRQEAAHLVPHAEVRVLSREPVRGALLLAVEADGSVPGQLRHVCLEGIAGLA